MDVLPAALAWGFEYDTGRPLVPATVLQMNALSIGGAVFAFILLLRFRDLVLVKRTRASQRNWYVMLGLMCFASILTFGKKSKTYCWHKGFWKAYTKIKVKIGEMIF